VRLAVLALLVLGAVVPYAPLADVDPLSADAAASAAHRLGTDHLGRDVLHRVLAGARAFLVPGGLAAAGASAGGVALGALAGWFGGVVEGVVRGTLGAVRAVPPLVLTLLVMMAVGAGPGGLALGAALAALPGFTEVIADRLASLRRAEFVLAARAHGIGSARVLLWHLLWVNTRRLVLREALATVGQVLVLEVTLSYLGRFGVPEPTPSWGNMIDHALRTGTANPLAWAAPAAAVMLTLWATVPPAERR
jgi:ABC-type dipeptide/oligopeptide/nickel transport system permease subunit